MKTVNLFLKKIFIQILLFILSFGDVEGKRVEFIESINFDNVDYTIDKLMIIIITKMIFLI